MGAWIEIEINGETRGQSLSHPLWVRGLKYIQRQEIKYKHPSHPLWVRGLK